MARFVAISGPASTGKTQLIDSLSTYPELSEAVFSPDIYTAVWDDLVENKYFTSYDEINRDSEYLPIYLLRLIEYYDNYIKSYENVDKLVILDGSWVDLSIYAITNMWYSHIIREVQEDILTKLNKYNNSISRIYFTSVDESKYVKPKFRLPYRIANLKSSRPLEIQLYKLAHNYRCSVEIPTTDNVEASMFIVDDLRNLGYI